MYLFQVWSPGASGAGAWAIQESTRGLRSISTGFDLTLEVDASVQIDFLYVSYV